MHAFSDYPSPFSLRPSCDYLSSRILTPPVVRRRLPQIRSSTLRKDRMSRPLSTSFLETVRAYGSGDSHTAAVYAGRHFSRKEIPLCTPDELLDIIREPSGYYSLPTDPWNEVYPGVYLSDAPTAMCTSLLKRMGITHVLNAAQGKEKSCGQVNTWSGFYSQSGIQFLGVPAFDNVVFRIYPYFEEASQFIQDALKTGGKVLVHCRAGISRSATLVCAYLMLKEGFSVQEAVKAVRKHRAIIPNDGFLQQLCDLNDKLKRKNNI
ncbi:dual specificity protein phosphatase 3-like [Stegodyphus dumicola]|uniref:dual specificity protein phosphatase 3-like n=1 Tax=Stegodyphus dumicola TaxID=202533 RepID=UPI0015A82C05|nr:dual specificity protein phosphatase 3-like [Stegodyphus dumicola]